MTKESSSLRKCSHCGHNGHNSRTCNNVKSCGFKLFGVRIDPNPIQIQNNLHGEEDHCYSQSQSAVYGINDESIRKTKSMGNLQACSSSNVGINIGNNEHNLLDHGYLSDGLLDQSKETHDRKKGVPWTEYEHRSFLIGLKKLGKGDWRGISKNYVPSRTPTQVASHAQKYFIRMNATEKRKRRSSLFDMPFKESDSSPTSSVLPSNEAPDVSLQLGTAPVAPLKNTTNNIKGQATISAAPVITSERPPLSPVARTYGVQDFQCMPYMVGYPSNKLQKFSNSKCMPTVSFVPVVNYTSQSCVYPLYGHGNGNFTFHSPFVPRSSTSLLSRPLPMPVPHESSQAGPASAVPKKEGLEASIGALSL